MLFQNSCVVPFGMTAIVNFFLPLVFVQLIAKARISNNIRSLRMFCFPIGVFHTKAQSFTQSHKGDEESLVLCAFVRPLCPCVKLLHPDSLTTSLRMFCFL